MDKKKTEGDVGDTETTKSSEHQHSHAHQPTMTPNPPAPGIYQQGNRQLALLPKVPTGQGPTPMMHHHQGHQHQGHFGYTQQPFMYGGPPQMVPMMGDVGFGGFNSLYDKPAPVIDVKTDPPTPITITRHICANCGTLRSRKYQAEHPLKPGEVAPVSFCRKCEKEFRSTDSEAEVEIPSTKFKKYKKKLQKMASTRGVNSEKEQFPMMHTCGECGNPRSRKYQARHPLHVGEVPPVSYCGKCQKDNTSSEDSNASVESEGETVTYVTRGRNSNEKERGYYRDRRIKNIAKNIHRGSNVESEVDQFGTTASKVTPTKTSVSRLLRDLITGQRDDRSNPVEEYTATEKQSQLGRNRNRHRRYFAADGNERPQSPLVAPREPIQRGRSTEFVPTAERRTRSSARRTTRRAKVRPILEKTEYDSHESSDLETLAEQTYRNYLSDGAPFHEQGHQPRRSKYGTRKIRRQRSGLSTRTLEDDVSEDSLGRSRTASRNGFRARSSLPAQDVQSVYPEIQKELDNLNDNEMLVVTERYFYRPQRSTSAVDEPMQDEHVNKGRKGSRAPQKYISQVDSAEYFPEEWSRTGEQAERRANYQPALRRDPDNISLRTGPGSSQASHEQGYHEDSQVSAVGAEIQTNVYAGSTNTRFVPPAPTPPSVSTATSGSGDTYSYSYSSRDTYEYPPTRESRLYRPSRLPSEFQPSSDSGASLVAVSPRRTVRQQRSPTRVRRGSLRYRPPYARDANSGGSDGARVSSRSPSRDRVVYYSEEEPSEMTANDRIERRRVSFGPSQVRTISRESVVGGRR